MKNFLVVASNTDCGKTLLSAGLVRGALNRGLTCSYIKVVQTGMVKASDADAGKVTTWTKLRNVHTLFQYHDPVSPHLAAARENRVVSSFTIREALTAKLDNLKCDINIIETAGGVFSPFPDQTLAADALQLVSSRMNFRTLLVGSGQLGGISQTLAALEVLESRMYDVSSLVLFSTDEMESNYGNGDFLQTRLIQNPPVRRIRTPIPGENKPLTEDFFSDPSFDVAFSDAMNVDHDRRSV